MIKIEAGPSIVSQCSYEINRVKYTFPTLEQSLIVDVTDKFSSIEMHQKNLQKVDPMVQLNKMKIRPYFIVRVAITLRSKDLSSATTLLPIKGKIFMATRAINVITTFLSFIAEPAAFCAALNPVFSGIFIL